MGDSSTRVPGFTSVMYSPHFGYFTGDVAAQDVRQLDSGQPLRTHRSRWFSAQARTERDVILA